MKSLPVGGNDILASWTSLGLTYMNLGILDKAERLQRNAMGIREKKIGTEHPLTLTNMGHLASIYQKQKRWTKAEELLMKERDIRTKVQGKDHGDTLQCMVNLGGLHEEMGQRKEASAY